MPKNFAIKRRRDLDHLRESVPELTRREGPQDIGVDDHHGRLMECTDQILSQMVIDAGLSADAAVDLRKQTGRNLHELDPAEHTGGCKARKVAHHAASERDDHAPAAHLVLQQRREDRVVHIDGFRRLACRDVDQNRIEAGTRRDPARRDGHTAGSRSYP